MKLLKSFVGVSLLSIGAVWAGDVEDTDAAHKKKDHASALTVYKTTALKGNASTQFSVGAMYADGVGVIRDYTEAMRWYKLAAAQGYAPAQFNLGSMYNDGQGVEQDYAEAVRCYKLAAAQGNVNAQFNLGSKYNNGQGVVQDFARSHMWYSLAAMSGAADAVKNRDSVEAKMTPQQIAEAQKMARECQERKFKNCD